ncbi:hypothetical protein [Bradyrhizobium sp. UFLA03-84]|uniref:hypothetical protein n=1 Tax=Bradyrhizobium sp. UFLA03-84 TaxID=418599 RepID=UPI0011781811|nr:hypothetical protein [Bradyrhizobium sp. UFLA03-84]
MKDGGYCCHLNPFIPDLTQTARVWTLRRPQEQIKNIVNRVNPEFAASAHGSGDAVPSAEVRIGADLGSRDIGASYRGGLADRPGIPRDDARFAYPRRTGVQGPDDLTDRLFRVDIPE